MKKQKGITLIALIITIIVMLILVGVTINVALNGGLFGTTEWAADQTKTAAEKEQLLAAVLATIGTNGKVDFRKVVLPEGFSGSDGTYTGKSGTTYTVDPETLFIEGSTGGGSEDADNPMLGTYYVVNINTSGEMSLKLKSNNQATLISDGKENSGTYTYNENTKTGEITIQFEDVDSSTNEVTIVPQKFVFNYIEITGENGNVINSILEATTNISGSDSIIVFAKEGATGLIPLTGYVYENGIDTIEFSTFAENGITLGGYTIKTNNGSNEGLYICYNGKLVIEDYEESTIASDLSTITVDGTVYTLKQQ